MGKTLSRSDHRHQSGIFFCASLPTLLRFCSWLLLSSLIVWWLEQTEPLPYKALAILTIVVLNGVLGFVQERNAEQTMMALRSLSAAQARVARAGVVGEIPAEHVVPGDILVLEEGDLLATDGRLIETVSSEATLTGESVPVSKHVHALKHEAGLADRTNMVFRGTAITTGRGRAVVTATGAQTEIGKIARFLQQEDTLAKSTPLQRELNLMGKWLGVIVIFVALFIGLTLLFFQQHHDWQSLITILLVAIALAVAAVPEGLAAITTIVFSLGMQRMAQRQVIVRKLMAVETLGSTTVICTDKTGTLTRNEMTVRILVTAGGQIAVTGSGYDPSGTLLFQGKPLPSGPLQQEALQLLRASVLVNNASSQRVGDHWTIHGDPTEGVLPDRLLARCATEYVGNEEVRLLNEVRRQDILSEIEYLASQALRTLGVAMRSFVPSDDPRVDDDLTDAVEADLIWLG